MPTLIALIRAAEMVKEFRHYIARTDAMKYENGYAGLMDNKVKKLVFTKPVKSV